MTTTRPHPDPLPLDTSLRRRIEHNMKGFERHAVADHELRPAAVALLIAGGDGGGEDEACFVITRRASGMSRHAGQWALPGGRLDANEDAIEAALRETSEEIGLRVAAGDVLGLLDDYPTRSGFVITPVVVWAGAARPLRANPEEVAAIHRVPLRLLEAPGVPRLRDGPEPGRPLISIAMLGTHIHAPTAALLYQLREVGLHGRATRVAQFGQPAFAWK